MDNLLAYNKLAQLPKELQSEVIDFIDFLLNKEEKKQPLPKPKFGSAKGMFTMKPGFDDPLEDFKEYME
jgi:hypothetical protein